MRGSGRVFLEIQENTGQSPFHTRDSDADFDPAVYEDVVDRGDRDLVITANPLVTDAAVSIPDVCALIIEADADVKLRLEDGESQMTGRNWYFGSGDSGTAVLSARDLLFSSGDSLAHVRISWLRKVT